MAVQGKINELSFSEKPRVFSTNHPYIILTVSLPALGLVSQGTVIGKNVSTGDFVIYDPNATDANGNPLHEPYGVLVEDVDTDKSTYAHILVFGVVYEDAINVKGNTPTSSDKEALRALNIYVVNRT